LKSEVWPNSTFIAPTKFNVHHSLFLVHYSKVLPNSTFSVPMERNIEQGTGTEYRTRNRKRISNKEHGTLKSEVCQTQRSARANEIQRSSFLVPCSLFESFANSTFIIPCSLFIIRKFPKFNVHHSLFLVHYSPWGKSWHKF